VWQFLPLWLLLLWRTAAAALRVRQLLLLLLPLLRQHLLPQRVSRLQPLLLWVVLASLPTPPARQSRFPAYGSHAEGAQQSAAAGAVVLQRSVLMVLASLAPPPARLSKESSQGWGVRPPCHLKKNGVEKQSN
jgi:hypothetical protein